MPTLQPLRRVKIRSYQTQLLALPVNHRSSTPTVAFDRQLWLPISGLCVRVESLSRYSPQSRKNHNPQREQEQLLEVGPIYTEWVKK